VAIPRREAGPRDLRGNIINAKPQNIIPAAVFALIVTKLGERLFNALMSRAQPTSPETPMAIAANAQNRAADCDRRSPEDKSAVIVYKRNEWR
jgi:hypothetical protein